MREYFVQYSMQHLGHATKFKQTKQSCECKDEMLRYVIYWAIFLIACFYMTQETLGHNITHYTDMSPGVA